MTDNFETYAREYADAAGLRPTDMPSSHHPLLESNAEVRELSDLIDARDGSRTDLPAKRATAVRGADRLTTIIPDDDDEAMTLVDFESEMDDSDPDPNAGNDSADYIGDARIDRAPGLSGTVTGIARGMSTHLPQDLGADGFQILEPEDLERSLVDEDEEGLLLQAAGSDDSAGVLPTHPELVISSDDALDAARRLR